MVDKIRRLIERWHGPANRADRSVPALAPPRRCERVCWQRHGGDVFTAPCLQRQGPPREPVGLVLGMAQYRSGTMDEQRAQISISALADAQEPLLAPAGVLARRQTEVGRHRAAIGKLPGIAHGGDYRGGRQGAQARQSIELAAWFIGGTGPLYPCIITGNPFVELPQLLVQVSQKLQDEPGQPCLVVSQYPDQTSAYLPRPLGKDNTRIRLTTPGSD